MKMMSDIAKEQQKCLESSTAVLCKYIQTPFGSRKLEMHIISTEHVCEYCGGIEHYTPCMGSSVPSDALSKCWMCANLNCATFEATKTRGRYVHTFEEKRALKWPLFCENNDIGDMHYNILFERIEQKPKILKILVDFCSDPRGVMTFSGQKGSGKTYAAMGICEFFTRKTSSIFFSTQRRLLSTWNSRLTDIEWQKSMQRYQILVIDDFGTGELPTGFMTFFMDLIDARLQWKGRGTILTTNLSKDGLYKLCGDALSDRIDTGVFIPFASQDGQSRRKSTF